ncbi:MAG TPA: maleylpyruvate isomerase family mycothiol-dependent enzyme [Catenuloplanes sp.]
MTKLHMTKDFWLAALRADGPALRAAAADAPGDLAVPSCPEWTVEQLVRHVGALYAWVGGHVARGVTTAPEPRRYSIDDAPTGPAALGFLDEQYTALVRLLDGLDPELPAWHPVPQAKKAGFWYRRMAHETAVHRWDVQLAIGHAEPVEAKLAADGVGEVLDSLLPAGRRRGPVDRHGVAQLVATDISHEWLVRLRGEGIALLDTDTLFDSDDHHTRVLAAGTASDVLLALYGRLPFDTLDVTGDATLLQSLRTG